MSHLNCNIVSQPVPPAPHKPAFAEVLDAVARRYGQRPSEMVGIDSSAEPFLALIYDIDVAAVGTKAEADAIRQVEFSRNTQAATVEQKSRKMKEYLDTLPKDSPVRQKLAALKESDG